MDSSRKARWSKIVGMKKEHLMPGGSILVPALLLFSWPLSAPAADKFVTIHSSRVMSQSTPRHGRKLGCSKKNNINDELVFIASSGIVTAALLGAMDMHGHRGIWAM